MEAQVHMKMAQRELQEQRAKEPVEEITEEQFLKELYLFMKKRDTPIERIPHLGFKQIDLFIMFKTVSDLGGYHQVTAQQLWKQVYNTLGGNPRSTSAATCTRRHYEKLLLPYECHVKGISVSAVLPQYQPKTFHFAGYSKDNNGGPSPAKRKMISIPLHQNLHNPQTDRHRSIFPLPLHYPPYYHPSHQFLSPYVPIPSPVMPTQSSPAPKPQFPFSPPCLNSTDRVKEPLEHLRYLAEQYKTSSGLTEPLNLSVKASAQETNRNPISSFAPPSSSTNPKFLNQPSTLYARNHAGTLTNEGCETQDGDSSEATPSPYPPESEAQVVDVKVVTASSSPVYDSALTLGTDKKASTMALNPSSPKTDFTVRSNEDTQVNPEGIGLNLNKILPALPKEKDGKMEIEIPLSVFHKWLKMCGSSAMMQTKALPPTQEEHSKQSSWPNTDIFPTNLTCHVNPQHQSSDEDLRPWDGNHPTKSQSHFMSYKPSPSGGILRNGNSQDIQQFDQHEINKSYNPKTPNFWDTREREIQSSPIEVESDSSPVRVQEDIPYKFHIDVQGGKQKSEMGPPAVLMVNSSSASLLQLTTEEVMKLKKIISSST